MSLITAEINHIIEKAQSGSQTALEELVRLTQDRIYNLANRMLVNPEDAKEATQEILILIITNLSTFEGRSSFHTWCYRIAANYLTRARSVIAKDPGLTFDIYEADLVEGLSEDSAEDVTMINELRISCTMAMLLCLDLKHRVAYVLGDILDLDHSEAAEALEINPGNYRKRLSRARKQIETFTAKACGVVSSTAKCQCPKRLNQAMQLGRIDPNGSMARLKDMPGYEETLDRVRKVEGDLKTLTAQRAISPLSSPHDYGAQVTRILEDPTTH